ncbi:MAG: ABC transporter permease [Spirochaetaceae bacterium]
MRRGASLFLALRYLRGRGERGGSRMRGAILAIGISLVPLVVVLQLADGMIQGITDRFIEVGTYHLQAVHAPELPAEEAREAADRVARVRGVTGVVPERRGMGLLSSESARSGVTVRAVPEDLWSRDEGFRRYIDLEAGEFDLGEGENVVLGKALAEELEVGPGDRVRLLTVRSLDEDSFLPRVSRFNVAGVISTGYQELDQLWMFMPFERGVRVLPEGSSRQILGIKIKDPYSLPNPLTGGGRRGEARYQANEIARSLGMDWRLFTWYELERSRYMSFRTTKNLLVFIMGLIVVVASVNISSSLVMLVLEKQSEIAILKSTGASPAGIRRIFVLCGFFSGVAGGAIGIAVGLAISVNLNALLAGIENLVGWFQQAFYMAFAPLTDGAPQAVNVFHSEFYLETIPITVDPGQLLLVAVLTTVLATLAALVPAHRAGRVRPLEVMRRY